MKIDNGTGGSRETSTDGSGSRPGRSAVDERGRESIKLLRRDESWIRSMSAGEQRKLAAIMFTDMVGYSALAQRNEKLALELLEEHRAAAARNLSPVQRHRNQNHRRRFPGRVPQRVGSGPVRDRNPATLAKRNTTSPADRRIEMKIGIHIGDVVHRGGDVYGDGVNIASRIEPLAGAGGICVSMDVERQIRNALEARFEKLAPTELKNISGADGFVSHRAAVGAKGCGSHPNRSGSSDETKPPRNRRVGAVVVLVLLMIGIGWWWTTLSRRTPPPSLSVRAITSLAVLPFKNYSRDEPGIFCRWNDRSVDNRTERDWRAHGEIAPIGVEVQRLNEIYARDRTGTAGRRNRGGFGTP